ncbi:MAG: nuclear transport factor 2 family protein [Myxococcaceae bacterium]
MVTIPSAQPEANAELLRRLWEAMQARRWEEAAACLAEDVVVDWPHTRERFRGRDRYLGMNRAYPEGWTIRLLRVVAAGDQVVSEIEVAHEGQTFNAATFATVRDGRIAMATEYWVTQLGEQPPAWRLAFGERY